MFEETGIKIKNFELIEFDSVFFDWEYKTDEITKIHHIGAFYMIHEYENDIKENICLDQCNNDSLGAKFYNIEKLDKNNISEIAQLILKKMEKHDEKTNRPTHS